MKASSKYGSRYPQSPQSQPSRPGAKAVAARRRGSKPAVAPLGPPAASIAMKLPHERDEAVEQGGGHVGSEVVAQAYRDVQGGLRDTDRSVEVHKTYQKQKT